MIDSMRGIAALTVLAIHAAGVSGLLDRSTHSVLQPFVARLDVGVTIFFLISGFLLYKPFVKANITATKQPKLSAYLWRRFLRIAPAYWVALTIFTVWVGIEKDIFTVKGIFTFYGFAQNYSFDTLYRGMIQAWTLGVEVTFYLMLPIYALLVRKLPSKSIAQRVRNEWLGVGFLVLISTLYNGWGVIDPTHRALTDYEPLSRMLPAFLDHFAIGMALAVTVTANKEQQLGEPRISKFTKCYGGYCWTAALVLFLVVSKVIGIEGWTFEDVTPLQYYAKHLLYAAIALLLLLPAVFGKPGSGVVRKVLTSPALIYIGLISYSIYLYHLGVLIQMQRWDFTTFANQLPFSFGAWLVIGTALTVIVATFSYYLVERPAQKLKHLVPK